MESNILDRTVDGNRKTIVHVDICETKWFPFLMGTLTLSAFINLAITFFIFKSLQFGNGSIALGNFHVTSKGFNIKTGARFNGWMRAEEINGLNQHAPIFIKNKDGHFIITNNNSNIGNITLELSDDKLKIKSPNISVFSDNVKKKSTFSITDEQTLANIPDKLYVKPGGLQITEKLDTKYIHGSYKMDLKLESRTKNVEICASDDLMISSMGQKISIISYKGTTLNAKQKIVFKSSKIQFKNLQKQKSINHRDNKNIKKDQAYQVCMCRSGTIFLAPPSLYCSSNSSICSETEWEINY